MIIELTQDWGNRLLEGTNKTSCTPRPRRKEQGPPQETDPDSPVSVQESPAEVWVGSRLLQSAALNTTVRAQDLLKEVAIVFITPSIFCSQVKQQRGKTVLPINRILD